MNRYVIAAPAVVTDVASWAPFADEEGMGYIGTLIDGTQRTVRLTVTDDALELSVDGLALMSFTVGDP